MACKNIASALEISPQELIGWVNNEDNHIARLQYRADKGFEKYSSLPFAKQKTIDKIIEIIKKNDDFCNYLGALIELPRENQATVFDCIDLQNYQIRKKREENSTLSNSHTAS